MKQQVKKVSPKVEPLLLPAKKREGDRPYKGVAERTGTTLHASLIKELAHFMEYHPAKRLNKNLRTMLIDFLMFEGATEVNYLDDLLYDVNALFVLLDVMEEGS